MLAGLVILGCICKKKALKADKRAQGYSSFFFFAMSCDTDIAIFVRPMQNHIMAADHDMFVPMN